MTRCACPCLHAQDCANARSRTIVDDFERGGVDTEEEIPCVCSCHPPDLDDNHEFWDDHDQCGGCGRVIDAGERYCTECQSDHLGEPT